MRVSISNILEYAHKERYIPVITINLHYPAIRGLLPRNSTTTNFFRAVYLEVTSYDFYCLGYFGTLITSHPGWFHGFIRRQPHKCYPSHVITPYPVCKSRQYTYIFDIYSSYVIYINLTAEYIQ